MKLIKLELPIMKLTAIFISIFKKLIFIGFACLTIIILACYISGPPQLPQTFETVFYTEDSHPFKKSLQDRKQITLNALDESIIKATIAVEDKNFYNHFGFDFKRIAKAIFKNIRSFKLKEGASTITQQYARNLYLTHDKTWKRKLKEAFFTIRLEMFYTKDDILEGYLNTIYYGHGAYGIVQASEHYFNKHVNDLSIAEVSLLIGIPKGPTYYSPFNNEKMSLSRQSYILNVLHNENIIDKQTYNNAKNETLSLTKKTKTEESFAPYFLDHVLQDASSILNIEKDEILNDGYHIYTTLNQQTQQKLEETITHQLTEKDELEIAALAVKPQTGAIEAMVGGKSYHKSSFNRAINARRLVGSTFKPIVYYSALENGFSPSTMLKSEPTTFKFDQNKTYKPQNFNNYYANKPITLAQAIALSDNIYAVKTNIFLGPNEVVKTAEKFGITSDLPAVPSLALGSASITINEMTQAYSMISNGGKQINNHTITKIVDRHGKTVYKQKISHKQQLDQKKTFILSHLLTGMFDSSLNGHMEVTGNSIAPLLTQKYAGKSGTTESDSWMIGYSPDLVTTVWTGYDDNRKIHDIEKQKYAKEIWAHFMERVHPKSEQDEVTVPDGLIAIPFDHETGKIATEHCPASRITYFEKGTEPRQYCDVHQPPERPPEKDEEKDPFFKRMFDLFF